jgi:hypothetical protein
MIQSIIIDRHRYTLKEATEWIRSHGYVVNKKPANFKTKNYYRFRQLPPNPNKRYRMKEISPGILLVLAY